MIRVDRSQPGLAALLTVALTLTVIPACFGQAVAVGSISGQVADPTGALIPGAEVTATQTETQFSRTATTDPEGYYTLPNLPVGPYLLTIKAQGFKTYDQKGIILEVGNNVQSNAKLEVGAVSENVSVSAAASMVETKENTVAQVIEERRITELPLNGRQATQLILISGAAAPTPAGNLVVLQKDSLGLRPNQCPVPRG
jgi:Carboxypeptidase regulatory-like domain